MIAHMIAASVPMVARIQAMGSSSMGGKSYWLLVIRVEHTQRGARSG